MEITLDDIKKKKYAEREALERNKKLAIWKSHATSHSMVNMMVDKMHEDNSGRKLSTVEEVNLLKSRAICPQCESLAFRDKGWKDGKIARCPKCGWSGKTITIDEYLNAKAYQ